MAAKPRRKARTGRATAGRPSRPTPRPRSRGGFVGRDPSPVKDSYPEKAATAPPPPRPLTVTAPATPTSVPGPAAGAPAPQGTGEGLIRLERPFDPDEVSRLLGETSFRLTVPRDALPEVLRRVVEFMGFGIYVYAISVRPAPSEMLRGYVVELQRVDYDAAAGTWRPFVERGTVPSGADPGSNPP